MKKEKMNNKRKQNIGILLICLLVFTLISGYVIVKKMMSYIEENGKNNMAAVMDQMSQSYDIQVETYYRKLEQTEKFLFQNGQRNIKLSHYKRYFHSIETEDTEQLLFMKNNGEILSTEGIKSHVDIQNQMLIDLNQNRRIAQSITMFTNGKKENYFLVAVPCEPYTVDGESYNEIAMLYDNTQIDSMLELNGYGGDAYIFLVDEKGIVNYTNQTDENFYRNYSVLKHLKKDKVLSDAQYDSLSSILKDGQKDIELIDNNDRPFYMGCYPVKASNHNLICFVARNTVNNTLLGYQKMIVRLLLVYAGILFLLCVGLIYNVFKAKTAGKKAEYEEEKRQLQVKAMKKLAAEKERADEANRAKTDFLANMSHDIRTPMNAIVGINSLMEHEEGLSDRMREYIDKVQLSSYHLLGLINDILDMSKIESKEVHLNVESVSLAEQISQIESIIRDQAKEHHQSFHIYVNEIVHEYLLCDGVRLRQIFLNLLSNAVKYTQDGGNIEVELAEIACDIPDHANFIYTVTDNGYGMSPEFVEHIFDAFTRAENSVTNKIQGTGLGMAITKNIVDLMGGEIHVDSELGKGSKFEVRLTLPIDRNATCELDEECMLLISDEKRLMKNVKAAISETEMQLYIAATKEEGIQKLKEKKADIILLDGYYSEEDLQEMVDLFRKTSRNEVLIFCVSYERDDFRQRKMEDYGLDGVIPRPFFLSGLTLAIARTRMNPDNSRENNSIFNGKNFLCAEDNEINAEILIELLKLYGANCVIYPNGVELVEAFKSVQPGEYDAILMDVQMPEMNGLEAARVIRNSENKLGKTIPIIAITANAFSEDVQSCMDAGMDAHISKPVDIAVLEKTLRGFVRGGQIVRRSNN